MKRESQTLKSNAYSVIEKKRNNRLLTVLPWLLSFLLLAERADFPSTPETHRSPQSPFRNYVKLYTKPPRAHKHTGGREKDCPQAGGQEKGMAISATPAGKMPASSAGCLCKSSYLYDDKPGYPHRISQVASSQLNR